MAKKQNPGALAGATGVEKPSHAIAAGLPKIAERRKKSHNQGVAYRIAPDDGREPFTIYARGRDAWALDRLREAGPEGCTPITNPAPRWSAYIHNLRADGVPIETLHEPHDGPYPGTHGRYVLRAFVTRGTRHE
jgi:hypothetical protein